MAKASGAGAGAASRYRKKWCRREVRSRALKVAIGGKGGSGKTTIAATLARSLARRGYPVTAVDGDPNPNLGAALGVSQEQLSGMARVPKEIMEVKEEEGRNRLVLTRPVEEISSEYGVAAPDGVSLMTMTGVDHAGAG